MENKELPFKPSDWCKQKQDEAFEKGDDDLAMEYYELAKQWMERGL